MNNHKLKEAIISGNTLGSLMMPDDSIPTNSPLHLESFTFPHVIITDNYFISLSNEIFIEGLRHNFYYSNFKNIFGTINLDHDEFISPFSIMSKNRYKSFEWVLTESTLLFDSESKINDYDFIRKIIKQKHQLYALFLDQENIWNFHKIILPQIEVKDDHFLMQTLPCVYPESFRYEKEFGQYISNYYTNSLASEDHNTKLSGLSKAIKYVAFYHIENDGNYKNYYDVLRKNTKQKYKHLKIFYR